ncbi:hypothetical protein LguiA_019564 [Lonicera macranthoides]
MAMLKNWAVFVLLSLLLFSCFSSASATPPAKIVSGVVSNVVSTLFKWLWSLKSTPKTVVSSRSMMKFEGGYTVETVFDGSKLGIEPYSLEISPSGELLVLDSENSNIYKISTPLSPYSRPKLVAGSAEGYSGHVDGKLREARMNNPKGFTVDGRGNIYVADTMNMAIRKISDTGGKWGQGGGHVDGPSEDAKFSNDFDVVYIGSSCSLLVVDRGNQAIREIQLHDDDCAYNSDGDLHLGMAVLAGAAFFGYMLALLQRRVASMFSSPNDPKASMRGIPQAPYLRPHQSVRPPLIPPEDESDKYEDGLFGSVGRLILNTGSSVVGIFGKLFFGSKKKPFHNMHNHYQQPNNFTHAWPTQESFMIPEGDEPPPIERMDPTPRKTYPLMTKEMEPNRNFKKSRSFYEQQHHVQQQQQQVQQQQQRHYSSGPQTFYEQKCETNEIVFGAVQEQDGRREAVVIKAVDYGDPIYNNGNFRSRYNYSGYSYGY